jgi:3-hydroxybutyrate dehydrogenase
VPEHSVALITGSTSGIGLGIAEALAGEGMDLMLNGLGDAQAMKRTVGRLAQDYGVRVAYSAADISNPAQVRALVEAATREFGRVDVLVNNAGLQFVAPMHHLPAERWDAVLALNLSAAFHAIAAVLPQMLDREWGRIVNIATVHGSVASPNRSAYVAAQHGMVGLTKAVALETASSNITCNAICPAKECATPGQVGALTAFLCSEDAAQIRGVALPIDGASLAQ